MKRLIVTAAILALPPGAQAKAPTRQHRDQYARLYRRVAAKFGRRAPGRNILRWGLPSGRSASDTVLVRSIAVLGRMLAPPPPMMPAPVATTTSTPVPAPAPVPVAAAPSSSAGASGVPACASESGTNYSTGAANTNPSSGATGRYQITPGTAANYGCNLSTPGGQDACAQTIYANQGAGAWVGCGG